MIIQEKQAGSDTNRFFDGNFAKFDELSEYNCITPNQHKKVSKKFNLL